MRASTKMKEWQGGDLWNASKVAKQYVATHVGGPWAAAQPLVSGLWMTVERGDGSTVDVDADRAKQIWFARGRES